MHILVHSYEKQITDIRSISDVPTSIFRFDFSILLQLQYILGEITKRKFFIRAFYSQFVLFSSIYYQQSSGNQSHRICALSKKRCLNQTYLWRRQSFLNFILWFYRLRLFRPDKTFEVLNINIFIFKMSWKTCT